MAVLNPVFRSTVTPTPLTFRDRSSEIEEKLSQWAKRMGKPDCLKGLSIEKFDETPSALINKKTIAIPSWFLFKAEDIPPHLRITDRSDPRLADIHFYNSFKAWMNIKLETMGLKALICTEDDTLQLMKAVSFFVDAELSEKGKDFILGHELAHLTHDEQKFRAKFIEGSVFAGGLTVTIFLLFLTAAIVPLVHLSITVCVAATSIAVFAGSCFAFVYLCDRAEVEEEKRADIDSVMALGDARGGIYYFENVIRYNLAFRRVFPKSGQKIDEKGNYLLDKTHPPLTERVRYLREWQAAHTRV